MHEKEQDCKALGSYRLHKILKVSQTSLPIKICSRERPLMTFDIRVGRGGGPRWSPKLDVIG